MFVLVERALDENQSSLYSPSMRWTPLGLLVAGLLAAPAAAADSSAGLDSAAIAEPEASKPAPALVRLDQELTLTQEARQKGRISPERYEEFLTRFRADLGAAKAGASPTPVN